jgi:hypothetical protein
MIRRTARLLARVACLGIVLPSLVHAAPYPDPTVIEDYDPSGPWLEYTVINPDPGMVSDIVAMVIEYDPGDFPYGSWLDTANNWDFQKLDSDAWTSNMAHEGYPSATFPLSWQEFYGGMDYPFGAGPAAGYFVAYEEVSPSVYQFKVPSLAISPGETLGQFFVDGRALSTYYLADVCDATGAFSVCDLTYTEGEAVPEPSTLVLCGIGAAALLVCVRRRRRH